MSARSILAGAACACLALPRLDAQTATVVGQVVQKETGAPLGSASVSVVSPETQLYSTESGGFLLRALPPGEVRLRFRRIGFAPRDTSLRVSANDTTHVRIELTRLVIQLTEVVVNRACTDRTPLEEKPAILAELLDQVQQSAERARELTGQRRFVMRAVRESGFRATGRTTRMDTISRGPLPPDPYVPGRVLRRERGIDVVKLPELMDLADTTFTHNHCLWYAGQERFDSDSVIRVDFAPVPWLAKDIDLEGSIYVRADNYQLVGLVTRLNRIPEGSGALKDYEVRTRFKEDADGVPMLVEWELINAFSNESPPWVERGRVLSVRWLDPVPSNPSHQRELELEP